MAIYSVEFTWKQKLNKTSYTTNKQANRLERMPAVVVSIQLVDGSTVDS